MRFGLTLLVLVGCNSETPAEKPVAQSVAVAPKPVLPPEFDVSLETDAAVAKWQTDTLALADVVIHPADPKALDAIEAAFKVTPASVHAYVFPPVDPHQAEYEAQRKADDAAYDAAWKAAHPIVPPTAAHAMELEASHDRLEAGRMYAKIGDANGAKRMIKALKADGEWNAAAAIAYAMGDKEELIADMEKMKDHGGWDDRMKGLIGDAITDNKLALATELAAHFGWNVEGGDWDKQLGASKDPKVVRGVIQHQVTRWIEQTSAECRAEDYDGETHCIGPIPPTSCGYLGSCEIASGIVRLSKTDPAGSRAIAKEYLDSRYSNVTCYAGNGWDVNENACPSLDLYKLVRSDPGLKASYLGKVRLNGAGGREPSSGEMDGEWSFDGSWKEMIAVRALGDKDLLAAWSDAVVAAEAAAPKDCTDFDRYYCVQASNDLKFDRYLLGLPGGSTEIIDPFTHGEISSADLVRVWKELRLPVPADGVTAEKLAEVIGAAGALNGRGYEAEALSTIRTVLSADAQGLSVVDSLAQAEEDAVFLRIAKGDTADARKLVSNEVAIQRKSIADTLASADANLAAALVAPYSVAATNARVASERQRLGAPVQTTRLGSVEDARKIVAPVIAQLATTGVAAYEAAIVTIARNGDSSFLDAEVKARTASGDLAGVTRLLAAAPNAVAQQ